MSDWKDSIYSDATENYVSNPYPQKGETIYISVRVIENSPVKEVFLRYREFGLEKLIRMIPDYNDGLAYYKCAVKIKEKQLRYQFYFVTENRIYYYTKFRITDYIPDESRDFTVTSDYKPADWVKESVFYQIFPDRFCNGNREITVKNNEYCYEGHSTIQIENWSEEPMDYEHGHNLDFHGGDLDGITSKLDYLEDLGVNALYLNPIFLSPSTHKYDSLTYFSIDSHLGGEKALEKLSRELHRRNMKLMLDISINHVSSDSEWFNKNAAFYEKNIGAYNNRDKEEADFFFFDGNKYDT